MATPKKRTVLYLHVDLQTKQLLKKACAQQPGRVSQSTMAEQLLVSALSDRGLSTTGGKYGKNQVQNRNVR